MSYSSRVDWPLSSFGVEWRRFNYALRRGWGFWIRGSIVMQLWHYEEVDDEY